MGKLKVIENKVKEIMENNPETREDDFLLVLEVYRTYVDTRYTTIEYLLRNHKNLGIPSMESITRCRRRLQEHYAYLRSSEETQDKRLNQEYDVVDYVRGWED